MLPSLVLVSRVAPGARYVLRSTVVSLGVKVAVPVVVGVLSPPALAGATALCRTDKARVALSIDVIHTIIWQVMIRNI